MCTALILIEPTVSVGSVQVDAASPLRVRAVLMAVRSSVMCTAFSTVVAATSGLSVKLPPLTAVKVAVTDVAAFTVTTRSEERRVGKECRRRGGREHEKKKRQK